MTDSIVLICLMLASPTQQAQAAEPIGLVARGGIIAILEDNGLEGDPSPVLPYPGIGLSLPLGPLHFEPGLDIYATYYGYSANLARPVPYAIENRSALVVGSVLNLPLEFGFPVAGLFSLRFFAGPSADLRVCLAADGLEGADLEQASDETDKIGAYFWSAGRWLSGMAGLGIDLPASRGITLGIEGRSWYPAYRLWTEETLPDLENLRFALTIRALFR
jgi:hypothetical protein